MAVIAAATVLPSTLGTTQRGGVNALAKIALTERFAVIESTQPERPEQAPDQLWKRDLVPACAVSLTVVPFA
jgi:hypothetical protein